MPTIASSGAVFGYGTPDEDLAGIISRAGRLGIAGWRVATALRISPGDLATIEAQITRTRHDAPPTQAR